MKRFISCLLTVALTLTIPLSVSAATSKTGTEVTGKEVLEFVHNNMPTESEMESGKEAELAVVIQTREFASLKKHGFTVANFGAVLAKDGVTDGNLPRPTTKKNWSKYGWKYITDGQPKLYLNTFTNTNEEKGIYQKKDEYDAYKDNVVYYSGIGTGGKTQSSAANVSCLYDENNALYIKEENTFFKYEIHNPENDEIIGYMFIEKNPYIKSDKPNK